MEKSQALTKICSNCGLAKPLSAFLKMGSGKESLAYGNVCAACRRIVSPKQNKPNEQDSSTTSTTGVRISTKERVKEEFDKKQKHHETETRYYEERDEKEIKALQQEAAKTLNARAEKRHRETFLKKSSFLDQAKQAKHEATQAEKLFGSQEQISEESRINLEVPFVDTQIAGKVKYGSEAFVRLKALFVIAWLL